MYECIYCKQPFSSAREKGYHQRYCKLSPYYEKRKLAFQLAGKKTSENNKGKHWVPRTLYTFTCEKCGMSFSKELTDTQRRKMTHFFCSRKCANSRNKSESTKNKVSMTLKIRAFLKKTGESVFTGFHPLNTCRNCGVEISRLATYCIKCFKKCMEYTDSTRLKLRAAGLKAAMANAESKRSLNEIEFCKKCETTFKSVKHNEALFNGWDADIIIEDYKLAILWNGAWHYKKIKENQSLSQIQNRDSIKLKEIQACGYIPYVIKDMGKANKDKVEREFDELLNFIKRLDSK